VPTVARPTSTAETPLLHEIKHDGIRIMARRDNAGVRLITRHGNEFTAWFPLVVEAVSALPGRAP
jgi:bifunctional non-homologous end joining protein LigD